MINPLLVATDGYLPGATPLSIAVRGYLNIVSGIVRLEYRGGGQRGDAWDITIEDEHLRRILKEDDELFEMIIEVIMSGVLD